MEIHLFTDGACSGNPGPGGWGYLLEVVAVDGSSLERHEAYGADRATSNNRMELTAAIQALYEVQERIHNGKLEGRIVIHSDSQYVIKGITDWIGDWKAKGWKNSNNQPVKNQDLWERLDILHTALRPRWVWVKGHATNVGNIRADQLACLGRDEAASGM